MRKENRPGALASAAEAGIETCEQELDTKPDLVEQAARVLQRATTRIISASAYLRQRYARARASLVDHR